ncbi:MAG: hypothetical protein ACP5OP_07095 [Leptospirillia bacterium]
MVTFTFWTALYVGALVFFLEGASLSPAGPFHKAMVGGLYALAILVVALAGSVFLSTQWPTFSLRPPAFFLGAPS